MNESEIMAKTVKITSYFTRSSEADKCNNMELLPEGDNQLLCEGEKELGRDNVTTRSYRIVTTSSRTTTVTVRMAER